MSTILYRQPQSDSSSSFDIRNSGKILCGGAMSWQWPKAIKNAINFEENFGINPAKPNIFNRISTNSVEILKMLKMLKLLKLLKFC